MNSVHVRLDLGPITTLRTILDSMRPYVEYTTRNTWSPGSSAPTGQELILSSEDLPRVVRAIAAASSDLHRAQIALDDAEEREKTRISSQKTENDLLMGSYELEHGGPNPYYKCKACGAIVPGLRDYLLDHLREGNQPGNPKCPKS